jgi:hypothetical protein
MKEFFKWLCAANIAPKFPPRPGKCRTLTAEEYEFMLSTIENLNFENTRLQAELYKLASKNKMLASKLPRLCECADAGHVTNYGKAPQSAGEHCNDPKKFPNLTSKDGRRK